jgi:hypothetical protein
VKLRGLLVVLLAVTLAQTQKAKFYKVKLTADNPILKRSACLKRYPRYDFI